MTQPEQPDVPYRVQISAYYKAAEGAGLESLDVTWDQPPDYGVVAEVLGQFLPRRPQSFGPTSGAHAVMAGDQCRRTLCGHPRANHAAETPEGRAVGVGNGWCTLCHNAAKCESFVGPEGS